MSLSTDSALDSLADSARPAADPRHTERFAGIRELLASDLEWVERALSDQVQRGVSPADEAAMHLVAGGGKRVRPTATLLSAACFGGVIPEPVRDLATVVELVHSATLLHDDVIDEGMERRGAPTARLFWGNAVSVLAGDVLLVQSLQRTQQSAPELMPGLLDTLLSLVSGEIIQLRGRTRLDVTEHTYNEILQAKTASLFRFATSAGAWLAGASSEEQTALGRFGEQVGIAFQLVDDVLDYASVDTGKTMCADLREGKLTLPLVFAIEQDPELVNQVQAVRMGEDAVVAELRTRVMSSGACERVQAKARKHTEGAIAALSDLRSSPARTLLIAIARQMASRTR